MLRKKVFKGIKKKGIVESQMAWIFILFAGILILTVFYKIAVNQKQVGELRIQAEISSKIRSAITSFSTGYETKSEIKTANAPIKNSCEGISVKNSRPIKINVFSFEELKPKTSNLLVYSVPWSFPFDVDNLVLLIEPETKLIIVKNSKYSTTISRIKESFPEKANIIEVNTFQEALKEEGIGKKRIILFESNENIINQNVGKDFSVINIIPIKDIESFGKIDFYEPKLTGNSYELTPRGSSYYLGFSMLLAGINSDMEIYDCNFKKNLEKLNYFLLILEERTNQIYRNLDPGSECKNSINKANEIVRTLKTKLNQVLKNLNENTLIDFYDLVEKLKTANNELILKSCPEIY
ncbi:MAG: hypothetical protein QXU20_02495 [Candidatus Woesearchaeota archaeon]